MGDLKVGASAGVDIAGETKVWVGDDVTVEAAGSGMLTLGAEAGITAGSLSIGTADDMTATAQSLQINTKKSASVATEGTLVELSGKDTVEYVAFVWRSSTSFDAYENAVPRITGVHEVIVRSQVANGCAVLGGIS